MKTRRIFYTNTFRIFIAIFALILIPVLVSTLFSGYYMFVINLVLVYFIACIGLNILSGDSGQVSLGHAGFMSIGGYFSAILLSKLDVPFFIALPAAGFLSGAIGYALGIPFLRLGGLSLAIATLGFTLLVKMIASLWTGVTGGVYGLFTEHPSIAGKTLLTENDYFFVIYPVTVLLVLLGRNLMSGKHGRAFHALRDSETAAEISGIKISRVKIAAFAISGFYAGIAGCLYGHMAGRISPELFGIWLSIGFLAMIIIGGLGSLILGSLIGSIFFVILPEMLRITMEIQTIIFGALLMFGLIYMPNGVAGGIKSVAKRISLKTSAAHKNRR